MPKFKTIWADGGYTGPLVEWVMQKCGWNKADKIHPRIPCETVVLDR